ncbi:PIR Superfamily Protein [Plasmodium ovale curtisi]|uniref:PIR Superfamily Protein n=1 Tax=Plasmodium ovale curtisi TaxID=864141 RepID=A0A1A8X6Q6_PLAOA|nr:PIR Superfamily Protein [Plasmodium ovale curtisi]SBS99895.1 PIR Superfamily Protein [Plasmodium ovale curtisi]
MAQKKSVKEQFFDSWDSKKVTLDEYSNHNSLLHGLKEQNNNLYNMACSLTEIYLEANLLETRHPNICSFLNEWLNNKKNTYTNNGKNSEIVKLWDNYIEQLWIKLEQDQNRYRWCIRSFPLSSTAKAVSICFGILGIALIIVPFMYNYHTIRTWFLKVLYEKIKIKKDIDEDISNELLISPTEYSHLYEENNRIIIPYHST